MKKHVKHNIRFLGTALVSVFISSIAAVMLQFFKGNVLDCAIAGNAEKTLKYGVLLISAILIEVGLFYVYRRMSSKFLIACTKDLKQDVFDSILQRSYVDYREHTQGEYIAKYTSEADLVKDRYFAMLPALWEIILTVILVSLSLFILDWRIALITLFLLTTPLYIPKLIEKRLQRANADYVKSVGTTLSRVNDWLAGFEIIKNFSAEKYIVHKHRLSNDETMGTLLKDKQLGNLAQLLSTLISYLSHFIILIIAAWLVLRGDFTAGSFFVAVSLIDQLSYPLISLSSILRQLIAVRPSAMALANFISYEPASNGRPKPSQMHKMIHFENVTFAYDNEQPILNQFSLTVKKNHRCLIQGQSGCGKTTAINLLLKYYAPDKGSISIDGTSIAQCDDLYGLITVVRQEAVLFNDTLRNNLIMYHDIADNKLIAILHQLGLSKLANASALDSIIDEKGANFSGGEKKRICLARALLRNTDVLIFDEPLANLDDASAMRIEKLLLSITGKTIIIVSHQFSNENLHRLHQVVKM